MNSRVILLLLLTSFVFSKASGQFIFQNFNQEDGLSANHVRSLYKDREGFLWIGTTNGLNRFDGNDVHRYKSNSGQKDFYVNAIQPIDDDRNLLVGTPYGLRTFNKRNGSYYIDDRFQSLSKKVILAIHKDDQNRLWFVSYFDIYVYTNGRILPVEKVIPATKIMQGANFTESAFAGFCWDKRRKGFWVGGSRSYFIDCDNNLVYNKENNPLNYPILKYSDVVAIAIDKNENLWFSTRSDMSLNFWDCRKNSVERMRELDGKELTDSCNFIFVDSKNRLWISTFLHSAFFKSPGQPIQRIPYDQDEPNSIGYGHFQDALEDAEGNIWLGTINGVSKNLAKEPVNAIYNLPSYEFYLHVNFAPANSIVVQDSLIMASKEDGIVAYNMTTRTYKRYFVTNNKKDLSYNRFFMSVKAKDRWWFAGQNGVYFINRNDQLQKLIVNRKETNLPVNFIFEDSEGHIWFNVEKDALYRYDPKTGRADTFAPTGKELGFPKYRECLSFLKLKNNDIIFLFYGFGWMKFHMQSKQFESMPLKDAKNFKVSRFLEDSDGNIWSCAWGRGMMKSNPKGEFIDSISTSQGLLSDYIMGMGIDDRGYIWATSNEGLMFFNPKSKVVTEVHVQLGKTFQNYWLDLVTQKGKVYATMLDQVVVFNPGNFASIRVERAPHITSVRIFGKDSVQTKEITDLTDMKELVLSPFQDFLIIKYASLHHTDIPSLQYSYQLIGVDPDWVYAEKSTTVSYNNLTPGNYMFKVRSTDQNGKWMKTATYLKIEVLPQWWQTLWFFLLETLVTAVTGFLLYRNHKKKQRKIAFDNTIDYFANSVYGENSVNEICWDIARNCISQLHFEDCSVFLYDKERNLMVEKAAFGTKNVKGNDLTDPVELQMGEGVVGACALQKKPIVVSSLVRQRRHYVFKTRIMSKIAVPILHEGKAIGVIDSEHLKRDFFKREHIKALSTIAAISANKIAEALAEEQTLQKEMMLLEISKMLAESQLMALRAQMNPHFVFNCLNSIQECIVTEKYRDASKYLNMFAKLFRKVLQNSDKTLVTIREEIDVLNLYLELEQMRFEESFSYKIILDDDLEDDEIGLPSMLLQPYVENALWHGLMHKSGDRYLSITFEKVNEDIFKCIIEDNGIGRKKSFKIKEDNSKTKMHKSKGLQITQDRLDLLERQGDHASVEIIDKYSHDGIGIGTVVIIELSTFLKNT